MGRKPLYADNVARQQAYRDRVAAAERERLRLEAEARAALVSRRRAAAAWLGEYIARELGEGARLCPRYCESYGLDVELREQVREIAHALVAGRVYREVWRD